MRAPNKIFLLDSKPSGELEPEDQVSPIISDTQVMLFTSVTPVTLDHTLTVVIFCFPSVGFCFLIIKAMYVCYIKFGNDKGKLKVIQSTVNILRYFL